MEMAPPTPTKNKSTSNQSQVSSKHNLDGINMLLYLNALQRKTENELAISQKIDESYKVFQKRRSEYFSLYAKYVKLLKLSSTRRVLTEKQLQPLDLDSAMDNIQTIKEKLSSGSATDYIDKQELERFKKMLAAEEKHDNLKTLQSEMMDLKNATNAIKSAIESIEVAIENGTIQGLDLFVEELDMDNFPNTSKMHDTEI